MQLLYDEVNVIARKPILFFRMGESYFQQGIQPTYSKSSWVNLGIMAMRKYATLFWSPEHVRHYLMKFSVIPMITVLVGRTWMRWQWRCTPHSPKLQHHWNLTIRLFSVIFGSLVDGSPTPLQKSSRCILQPQPTGQWVFGMTWLGIEPWSPGPLANTLK